jgi:hypothetical protein
MSDQQLFLAVYVGSKDSARMAAWWAQPEAERHAREREGIAAWHAWVEKHQAVIVDMGGLFEGHPHFAIFPGDSVEVMPVLPIPGA